MGWIFLMVVFGGFFVSEIADRICECKEKCNKEDKCKCKK